METSWKRDGRRISTEYIVKRSHYEPSFLFTYFQFEFFSPIFNSSTLGENHHSFINFPNQMHTQNISNLALLTHPWTFTRIASFHLSLIFPVNFITSLIFHFSYLLPFFFHLLNLQSTNHINGYLYQRRSLFFFFFCPPMGLWCFLEFSRWRYSQ